MSVIFDNNQEDKDKAPTAGDAQPIAGTNAPTTPAAAAANAQNPTQRQGSGRFTNIQQYLNANKTGGNKLNEGVGNKIQKGIDPAKQQTVDYNNKVAQGIQTSQANLQKGAQGLTGLKDINANIKSNTGEDKYNNGADLGINQFVQDPNYADFRNVQSGNGVDENGLNTNQNILSSAQKDYYDKANTGLSSLGSESGRFDLLKQTFGGNANPQYNNGQQRLDQLLFQRSDMNGLKNNLTNEVNSAKNYGNLATKSGQDINNVINNEASLIGDIGTQAGANEEDYINMLSSYVPGMNKARDADWASLEKSLSDTKSGIVSAGNGFEGGFQKATPKVGPGLTAEQISRLGVNAPTRAYNVFNELGGAASIATKGAAARNYKDVANQQNVGDYDLLSQIANMNANSKRLTDPSSIGAAWNAKTGDESLTNRLKTAGTNWDANAKNAYTGRLKDYADATAADGKTSMYDTLVNDKSFAAMDHFNKGENPRGPDGTGAESDQDIAKYIRNTGYDNVLTPGGLNKLGFDPNQAGKDSNDLYYRDQGKEISRHNMYNQYDTSIDDQLKSAYQALIDQYSNK